MAKIKKAFFCTECGAEFPKWVGKCAACGQWNSLQEEIISKSDITQTLLTTAAPSKAKKLQDIEEEASQRYDTHNAEFNRVLGGGLVPGSVCLLGGEPGIGKSTLLLQLAMQMSHLKILYVSGEESEQQVKMRASRLQISSNNCYFLSETNLEAIFKEIHNIGPQVLILDSIQTIQSQLLESAPGAVSQIKTCAGEFQKYAKQQQVPIFLIGHITKDGSLAGPKVLEHMVDTVLHFEGDRNYGYRLLRTMKNRFGSTSELGIFDMSSQGLREVSNPSEILLSQRDEQLSGMAIAASLEGMRPMLIEIQALVSSAVYGVPQRSTTGYDSRRLNMLLAVLEKRSGFRLSSQDVFLNIAGGIQVKDPAIDLAVVCAILSSKHDMPIHHKICFAAEVGLSGEIRAVNQIEQRVAEAEKLGFEYIVISKHNNKNLHTKSIKVIAAAKLEEVTRLVFKTAAEQ